MDDNRDDFPDVLTALENATTGAFLSTEAIRALVRELHRLYQAIAELNRKVDAWETAAQRMPHGRA